MNIKEGVLLRTYTTFRIGGPADFFVSVRTVEELKDALVFARNKKLPYLVVGGGSNMLFPDEGYRGLIIHMQMKGIYFEEFGTHVLARASSGEVWDTFVDITIKNGLWGLENLSLIPGSVGATPVQNVGAYGVEVSDVIKDVEVFDTKTESIVNLSNEACAFGYRSSIFKTDGGRRYIVTAVTYVLSKVAKPNVAYKDLKKKFSMRKSIPTAQEIRRAVISIRRGKFPDLKKCGTAGSFFRSPIITKEKYEQLLVSYPGLPSFPIGRTHVKVVLSWFLDKILHLKGVREGDVGTHSNHALVIVNHKGASAHAVQKFAHSIVTKVFDTTGVIILPEVMIIENKKIKV